VHTRISTLVHESCTHDSTTITDGAFAHDTRVCPKASYIVDKSDVEE